MCKLKLASRACKREELAGSIGVTNVVHTKDFAYWLEENRAYDWTRSGLQQQSRAAPGKK